MRCFTVARPGLHTDRDGRHRYLSFSGCGGVFPELRVRANVSNRYGSWSLENTAACRTGESGTSEDLLASVGGRLASEQRCTS